MTTFEILDQKLDHLGGEMRVQTHSLSRIEAHTKSMAELATADQQERSVLYNRLADAIVKACFVFGIGTLLILLLCVTSTFKQEIKAEFQGAKIEAHSETVKQLIPQEKIE